MPNEIFFPDIDPVWEFDRACVRFYAVADQSTVTCLVSVEALFEHFGAKQPTADEAVRAFGANREAIQEVARRKIQAGLARKSKSWEVLLTSKDFGPGAVADQPFQSSRLRTRLHAEVAHDPGLLAAARVADAIVTETFARGGSRVSVEYSSVPGPDRPLLVVTLIDEESEVTMQGLFTQEDLENEGFARFSLFRLWDDLLRERGRRLLQSSQANAGRT